MYHFGPTPRGHAVARKATPTRGLAPFWPSFDANEGAYLTARTLLLIALVGLYGFGIMSGGTPAQVQLYLVATLIIALDSIALMALTFGGRARLSRAIMWVLVPDLMSFAILTYLGKPDDSFYAAILVAPLLYAFCVSKREAYLVGAGVTLSYVAGAALLFPMPWPMVAVYALKAAVVPGVTYVVVNAVAWQRDRERTAEKAVSETEHLNLQLRKRVHELQAVSEITEIIHASLDFDSVGPQLLEIVAAAIGVTECCLFIIDKAHQQTLFSASRGIETDVRAPRVTDVLALDVDNHLTCIPVLDRGVVTVLFCTTAESIERFSDEERLVLGAVASELVVAVENSRLYKLTRHLAITDELTGLANYRYLQQRLDDELARAARYAKPLSLLMLDADDFKAFNDRFGHVAGDVALAEIGPLLRGVVREVDLVARYGGEEFSVLLPETDAAGAYVVAEKIREVVELHRFADADGARVHQMTISAGVAEFPAHAGDKDALLRAADDALYHAKQSGRNRVGTPPRRRLSEEPPGETPAPAQQHNVTEA